MKKYLLLVLFLVQFLQFSFAQHILTKEEAIAMFTKEDNDMEEFLDSITAKLEGSIWKVTFHYCHENMDSQTFEVDAMTKKIKNGCLTSCHFKNSFQEITKSKINWGGKIDTLSSQQPQLLTIPIQFEAYNSCLEFSPNSEWILFSSEKNIGIVKPDGTSFKILCYSASQPRWLSNDTVVFLSGKNLWKQNIYTREEKIITDRQLSYNYRISPNKQWIAYTKAQAWPNTIEYRVVNGERKAINISHQLSAGDDYDTFIWDMNPVTQPKRVFIMGEDYHPCWSEKGDSLLFNLVKEGKTYFITDFKADSLIAHQTNNFRNLSLEDYEKTVKGVFPFIDGNQIFMVDKNTLKAKKLLLKKKNLAMTNVFSQKT